MARDLHKWLLGVVGTASTIRSAQKAVEKCVQEVIWVQQLLDRAGVPTESYEAQGGGMCRWTLAGRVDHLLRLLERHDVSVDEGVLRPVAPPRKEHA
jgi:hypothetical protein